MLVLAGTHRDAVAWRADGWHGRGPHRLPPGLRLRTAPVHDRRELIAAVRAGADLVFASPVFATRSHPGARPLDPVRFGLLTRNARTAVVALGGMNAGRFRRLRRFGASGWAAIDAWSAGAPDQKRPD